MRNVNLFLFKSKWHNFFILPLIFFASSYSYGQVSSVLNPTYGYTFSNSSTTYTAISGATVFQSGSAINTDGVSSAIALPFTFTYNGIKENTVFISNNGFITFGSSPLASTYTPISITTAGASGYDGAIAGTGMNCVASTASGATPEISYGTNSSSDFVVQFQDIGQSGFAAIRMTYQIILKSDGKTIQIVYGPNNVGIASAGQCQVGIRGTNDEDWNNRTLSSGGNWNTAGGATGTLSTSAMSLTAITTLPTSGRTFQWVPTAYLPTYNSNPTTYQEFTSWVNGSGPSNVPSTNWATNGYGNASWQIDNNPGTAATTGWGSSSSYNYSPVDYVGASGGHSARFHSGNANSPQVGYLDYYVDLSSLSGTPTLDFYHINTSGTDILQIFLSTDGGTTFTQIGSNIGTSATWTAKSISLGSTNSSTSIIRFKATADFGSTDIGIDHLVVTPPPTPPTISSFSPTTDFCFNGGQTITITGTNFTGSTSVTFNGVNATSYTIVSSTSITAVTPASLTSGVITVTNPAGSASSSTYNVALNPTVTVSPPSASLCTGDSPITLNASGAIDYTWSPATGLSATTGTTVDANPTSTTTYTVTGTDGNGCTNTATSLITVTATPVAPTTANYSICVGASIPGGQGLTSTSVGSGVITGSQTINFDVASQPIETNSAPGNIVASATMAALPAGSTVTSVVINYAGLTALSSSWRSDIKLGLSGSIINAAASDPLAAGSAGVLNYSRTASSGITSTISGGTVNLLYWDDTNDNAGAEATFPTGTAVVSVIVNYSYPSTTAIAWYDAPTGGNFIGNGSPFNPIGIDPALPNSNVAGTYTYYAQVNNGACSSTRTAAVLTIGSTPTATATASQSTICIGSSSTLSANPVGASPFTYLWSDPSAATSQAVSVSPSSNTTYTVTVTDACSTSTTATISINVDAPSVGSPTATSVCGTGTSTLSTTSSTGTINWYDAASNGNLVGTGTSVVSPTITSATTYYVEAQNIGTPLNGARIAPSATSSTTPSSYGLVFTATSSFLLNSVDVYPSNTGTITVQLQNSAGTPLQTQTFTVTTGSTTVPVSLMFTGGWPIAVGSDYRLLATSGTLSPVRESSLGGFPYSLPGVGNVTNGYISGTSPTYYYFYNWNYSSLCGTSRTAVVVPFSVPPTAGTATATPATICSGSSSSLNLSGTDPSYTSFTWSSGAGLGLPVSVMPSSTTTYTVTATDGTCSTSTSVTVTVNPVPSAVSITQGSSVGKCAIAPAVELNATDGVLNNVIILSENFNTAPVGWTAVNNSTSGTPSAAAWTLRPNSYTYSSTTFNSNDASQFYLSNSDAQGSGGITATILNTPVIDLSNFTSANLNFYHYYRYNGTESINVEVSLNNSSWTAIGTYTSTQGGPSSFSSVNIDLTAYVGNPTVYLRFKYDASWDYYWAIDNVLITGNQQATITWSPSTGLFTDAGGTMAYNGTDNAPTIYASPSSTQSYTVTATSALGCTSTASINVVIEGTTVTSTADAGPGTLRAALNCVVDGGTIMYDQPATSTTVLTAPLTIDKNVTIMGVSASSRPEITTSTSGISIDAMKTLTLKDVDVKSTAPTQTFTGAGDVSITGTTVGKQ